MNEQFSKLGRSISILDRLMKMYYSRELSDFEISWGQQFYVEYLYHNPGASAQRMVETFHVDKATLTKNIRKLIEIDYVRVAGDEEDRRITHLYLTEKALPAVNRIKEIHKDFHKTLSAELSSECIQQTEQIMEQMILNLNRVIWHRMEK
ncbi:MAG: MarR family transcriptional regulator [Lachnospiraceae bacterium]|nr:MarR family transcriptional regulator [Lachnospiraceae bacterium]